MALPLTLSATQTLPADGLAGTLVGRAWIPAGGGVPAGPAVVVLRPDGVFDISDVAPTMSTLLEQATW